MKRGFIRALWGYYSEENNIVKRRYRIDGDINRAIDNKNDLPFVTYVMGKDNYNALVDKGLDCRLIHDEPFMFNIQKYQYRHKLECIKYAMEEDGYDELVYLDWDCVPKKELPEDFWEKSREKGIFQANLQVYHRKKCPWRKQDLRKVPNGGFMYLGDKTLPQRAIDKWETKKQDNDEIAWALLVDEMMGGWKGVENYWENYEAMYCDLHRYGVYAKDEERNKDNVCFIHRQGGRS